jgi:hypothetical protein
VVDIKGLKSLILELAVRYACACFIGLAFLIFSSLAAARFMNHLGMYGSILSYDLGMSMVYEVPAWMLIVWLLKPIIKGPVVEVVVAGIVAVLVSQRLYFDFFWSKFILPTVDPDSKGMMLLWYVATVSNYMLATLTAILFCILHSIWHKRKARIASYG